MVAVRHRTQFEVLYAQLEVLPEGLTGEIIEGALHVSPRPSARHGSASSELGGALIPPFRHGQGGPGGWRIILEPELHLGRPTDVMVPDLAGWRIERLPELPDDHRFTVAPDWVCEVLSPSTERFDRSVKMPAYERHAVRYVWLIDTEERALEVHRFKRPLLKLLAKHTGNVKVRAEPFQAVEINLAWLWG